jgi:hypothetical protein
MQAEKRNGLSVERVSGTRAHLGRMQKASIAQVTHYTNVVCVSMGSQLLGTMQNATSQMLQNAHARQDGHCLKCTCTLATTRRQVNYAHVRDTLQTLPPWDV